MSGKKIGIMTLPVYKNYGGLLQAYALQKYLKLQGHEAVFVDRRHNITWVDDVLLVVKRFFFKNKYKKHLDNLTTSKNTRYFKDTYITPKSQELKTEKQLKKYVDRGKFDAIVVGSDQVWRLEYATHLTSNLFLDYVSNGTKKMSYAASFGVGSWSHNDETTTVVKNLLKDFDKISVREDTGVTICKDVFEVEATQHIDPTMLLSKEDYIKLVDLEKEPKKDGDILVYMLDRSEERKKIVRTIEEELEGKAFEVNVKSLKYSDPIEDRIYPTVTNWLRGFVDAKYVIVDSFHGCVFAILFNIPFIAFGNSKRGLTRFTSLLKLFKLESRLVLENEILTKEMINAPIDWELTNSILEECRKESKKYLNEI